jgi:hypothetical protein
VIRAEPIGAALLHVIGIKHYRPQRWCMHCDWRVTRHGRMLVKSKTPISNRRQDPILPHRTWEMLLSEH